MDAKENLLRMLSDLRETPENKRRVKLTKLNKSVLVQVASVMLRKWERERSRLDIEIEKRDYHIERLEALLKPKTSASKKNK